MQNFGEVNTENIGIKISNSSHSIVNLSGGGILSGHGVEGNYTFLKVENSHNMKIAANNMCATNDIMLDLEVDVDGRKELMQFNAVTILHDVKREIKQRFSDLNLQDFDLINLRNNKRFNKDVTRVHALGYEHNKPIKVLVVPKQ